MAIKKAYARKLKQNRPEDNAPAFQSLNEARDQALSWAKFQAPKFTAKAETHAATSTIKPQQKTIRRQSKVHAVETLRVEAPARVDELHDVIAWITGFETLIPQEKVDAAMGYIHSATFDQRQVAEERLLEAIESNFSKRVKQGPNHAKLSWNDPFNDAILKLDAEFGWANRDRELANRSLGPDLIDYLNNLRSHDSIFAKPSVVIKKKIGVGWSWWTWAILVYAAIKLLALLASI